uniref:Uncharacterized protein n=1 Tax=Rhodymenia pseudopalmata TaxID=31502 RepID=A0A1C9C7I4_RHOPU|nr:hypothetical protein Rhodyp_056 [Rhodymenia pseudopalmata]AOM64334.1 hypothetical protein Rhodyp_056 [Rhodymenia pseudopalmata]
MRYSYTGNLLNYEIYNDKQSITLLIHLSAPLFKVFSAQQYYSLVNWQSMIGLSKSPARLLYFYFYLNTKISSKFIEF